MQTPRRLVVTGALVMFGCGGGMHAAGPDVPPVISQPPSNRGAEATPAVDLDPDPRVVEIRLEARPTTIEYLPGKATPAWAYDGMVPGPLIRGRVGDTLVVHFTNRLPEATTIHWHGLRVPGDMDGVTTMMQPVPPGGSFDYRFPLKDAGTYWYHPHVRSDEQVEKGLYGALVVSDPTEPDLGTEQVFILDDVWLDEAGQPMADTMMTVMLGRQGNLLLVNGRANPVVAMQPGERRRWRLVNAANARYFRVALPGASLVLLGSEGGLVEAPEPIEEVLLSPGERVDLSVEAPAAAGTPLQLVARSYDRGHGIIDSMDLPLLTVRLEGALTAAAPLPERFAAVPVIAPASRSRRFTLEERHGGGHGVGHGGGGALFSINGEAFPNITPLRGALGASEVWEIENTAMMDHPFHLHGFRFQVLSRGGVPDPIRAWKDTVNVRPRETVRLAVTLDGYPGRWMYHCHILEHAEAGMMGELDVTSN